VEAAPKVDNRTRWETRWKKCQNIRALWPDYDTVSKADVALVAIHFGALLEGNGDDLRGGAERIDRELRILKANGRG
jgi:hypothetical protein